MALTVLGWNCWRTKQEIIVKLCQEVSVWGGWPRIPSPPPHPSHPITTSPPQPHSQVKQTLGSTNIVLAFRELLMSGNPTEHDAIAFAIHMLSENVQANVLEYFSCRNNELPTVMASVMSAGSDAAKFAAVNALRNLAGNHNNRYGGWLCGVLLGGGCVGGACVCVLGGGHYIKLKTPCGIVLVCCTRSVLHKRVHVRPHIVQSHIMPSHHHLPPTTRSMPIVRALVRLLREGNSRGQEQAAWLMWELAYDPQGGAGGSGGNDPHIVSALVRAEGLVVALAAGLAGVFFCVVWCVWFLKVGVWYVVEGVVFHPHPHPSQTNNSGQQSELQGTHSRVDTCHGISTCK